MAATTTELGLVTPTQGTLSGTWGDTVNYGITEYVNIAIAGTLSFAGDGAVTLANTTGNASTSNIGSTTAQYMVIRITGTQTVAKVITAPSYSKLYMVDHAGATSAVTFKASGQTGVSIAVGEKCFVYFNGTDYVKVASSTADGVTSVGGTGTVNGITLTGTVTSTGNLTLGGTLSGVSLTTQVTGTLPIANGGTGATSLTANNVILGNGTSAFQVVAPGTSGNVLTSNGTTWSSSTPAAGFSTSANNTFTGTQTFSGTASTQAIILNDAAEVTTVSATAATGTIAYDITTQSVLYYTSNASANWTVNFRGSSGTSLNTLMSTGQSMTVAFLVTQGATAYYNNVVQVDGTATGVTTRWLGGAPTAGNASGIDSYRYLIIKTGSATFTVLASNTQFKA